jgi:hypothetical protein
VSLPTFLIFETRQIPLICDWIDLQNLGLLDTDVSSYGARKQWLILLKSIAFKAVDKWLHSNLSMRWVITRSIVIGQILVNPKHRRTLSDPTVNAVDKNGSRTSCDEEVKSD